MIKPKYLIFLILILSLFLRLINLDQSLWLDEAINVLAAQKLGFWHFVTGYPMGDFHPPGYFALLWIWGHLFGFSEISVRIPSVLLGTATVYLTYLIGKKLLDQKIGLFAAILLATGPLHVYYSQEARMYSLSAFAATLSFYYFIKLISESKKNVLWYGLSLILIFYSDYLTYLIVPTQFIYALIFEQKSLKRMMGSGLIGITGLVPWLSVFPSQLMSGTITAQAVEGWKNVVGGATLKNVILVFLKTVIGRISIKDMTWYISVMVPLGVFYSWLLAVNLNKLSKPKILLFFWFLTPIILAFIISLFIPVLYYFRLLFIIPAFYLLISVSIINLAKLSKYLMAVVLVVNFLSLSAYYTDPQFQREDWKGVGKFIETQSDSTGVIFEDTKMPSPFEYYYKGKPQVMGGVLNFPARYEGDIKYISFFQDKDKILLVNYLVEISDPDRLIDKKLTSLGWKVVRVYDFHGVGLIYEYTR